VEAEDTDPLEGYHEQRPWFSGPAFPRCPTCGRRYPPEAGDYCSPECERLRLSEVHLYGRQRRWPGAYARVAPKATGEPDPPEFGGALLRLIGAWPRLRPPQEDLPWDPHPVREGSDQEGCAGAARGEARQG